jgi:hypothetical protein
MNLEELYRRLSYGELSNLAISGEGSGTIITEKRPTIISHLNDGMRKLYSRFNLREKTVVIRVQEGKMDYLLQPRYSTQAAQVPHPYIMDTAQDPFIGDIVRILEVFDSYGQLLPLNDSGLEDSLFTPQADILQIPNHTAGSEVAANYQAFAVPIELGSTDEIEIPFALESALQSWIAYKVYTNMNTPEATAKGKEHLGLYENTCVTAEANNILGASNVSTISRFELQGFV